MKIVHKDLLFVGTLHLSQSASNIRYTALIRVPQLSPKTYSLLESILKVYEQAISIEITYNIPIVFFLVYHLEKTLDIPVVLSIEKSYFVGISSLFVILHA